VVGVVGTPNPDYSLPIPDYSLLTTVPVLSFCFAETVLHKEE